jgi:hypothetical protein
MEKRGAIRLVCLLTGDCEIISMAGLVLNRAITETPVRGTGGGVLRYCSGISEYTRVQVVVFTGSLWIEDEEIHVTVRLVNVFVIRL